MVKSLPLSTYKAFLQLQKVSSCFLNQNDLFKQILTLNIMRRNVSIVSPYSKHLTLSHQYKRRSSSTTRPRSSSVRKPSGASTSRSMSSGYGQKINKDRNAEYGYPQYLMDGANEYLKGT